LRRSMGGGPEHAATANPAAPVARKARRVMRCILHVPFSAIGGILAALHYQRNAGEMRKVPDPSPLSTNRCQWYCSCMLTEPLRGIEH